MPNAALLGEKKADRNREQFLREDGLDSEEAGSETVAGPG